MANANTSCSGFGCSKQVLACGLVTDYRFSSRQSYFSFLCQLDGKPYDFHVLESRLCEDGTILARIVKQHNGCDLIHLPQSDLEV